MRIQTGLVPALCLTALLAAGSRADAFCPNDEWGALQPGIVGTSYGVALIWGDGSLYHYGDHPNCFGYFESYVQLSHQLGGGDCNDSDLNQHVPPEGSESVSAWQVCYLPCGVWAAASATYTWNGSQNYAFQQSSQIRQPCDCSPPGGPPLEGCIWSYYECDWVDCCPLVFDTSGRGYKLTSADMGAWFDINADGQQDAISWTDPTRDVAFLAFDRNGNGRIDHGEELFGNVTPLPGGAGPARHGFDALRSLEEDREYGASVADGVIDSQDAAYRKLLLWKDANHDGVSQARELTSAASAGLVAIETRHRESRRVDEHGNEYRLRGISWWQRRGRLDPRLFYDVWFVPRQ